MSAGRTGRRVADQDPEDIFELPSAYRDVKPLDRARCTPVETLEFVDEYAWQVERRSEKRAAHEAMIATALRSPQRVPITPGVLDGADFADTKTLNPLQAALVEAWLEPHSRRSVIDRWGGAKGLAFAFAAFVEYCHVTGIDDKNFVDAEWYMVRGEPRLEIMRLLEFVRSAPEPDRAEVMAVAERLRENEPSAVTRALTTLLFPDRPDFFWADLTAVDDGLLAATALLASVTNAEQASALAGRFPGLPEWQWAGTPQVEMTFLSVAGPEALPFLAAWCESGHQCPAPVKGRPVACPTHARCIDLIARTPSEAAMATLIRWRERDGVAEQLEAAVKRFPRRALRVLAEAAAPDEEIKRLLAMMVFADPDFARAEAGQLSRQARDRIGALLGDDGSAGSTAQPADLPELLAAPPWRDKKSKRWKPIVVEGLTPPAEATIAWRPGERESWLTAHGAGWEPTAGWASVLPAVPADVGDERLATYFAAYAPEELVRPLLDTWRPPLRHVSNQAKTFVAKYELLALPTVLSITKIPAVRAQLLQPFVSAEIAALMVDGLARLRSMRRHAAAWLRRHPEDAVRCLVPTALGKPGKTRQHTVSALRMLEAEGIDVATIAQQAYGEDVGTALKEVLAERGLGTYPRTVPQVPLWARAALLSEIRLKDGRTSLPPEAVQAVVEMLMFSKPDAPYAGLEVVQEVCDASSLAAFAMSLCEGWEQMGADAKDHWAFEALGHFGDASTVAQLQMMIRGWRRGSKTQLVEEGFDVLASIGGSRALAVLHTFAHRAWTPRLRRRAQAKFEDVAQSLDLSADQLADRLVPTLDLSAEGTLDLDYGRRRYEVSLDEYLRPVVTDESGTVLKNMPKPGKRDDEELATAAYKRFATLRKESQELAQGQARRLESAMLNHRRWTPEEFAEHLVSHPLLVHIVRRLVWGAYAEDGALLGSFRLAEDLSFADVDDDRYEVPQGALIGVLHPMDLAYTSSRWSEVFADYELLQPFDQLGRPPVALTAEELAGKLFVRSAISPGAVVGKTGTGESRRAAAWFDAMASRGWRRGPIGADRLWSRLLRPVGGGRYVVMELEPGVEAGDPAQSSHYQAVTAVWLSSTGDDPAFETHALPLSELDAVSVSAVLGALGEGV